MEQVILQKSWLILQELEVLVVVLLMENLQHLIMVLVQQNGKLGVLILKEGGAGNTNTLLVVMVELGSYGYVYTFGMT